MSLIQLLEINQQVTNLIKKGVVPKSMSPYVVPTLLTPKKKIHEGCAHIVEKPINLTSNFSFIYHNLDDMMWETNNLLAFYLFLVSKSYIDFSP